MRGKRTDVNDIEDTINLGIVDPNIWPKAFDWCQTWSRLKNLLKSKSKFIESKFSELKSKSVFIESVFYVFVFDFGTTSVYRKITIRYISIQNSTGVISINIELYRFYSVISKWHRFQLLLVFSLRNLGFRPIFYGTGSVQGFPHLGFRSIFI